MPKTTCIAQWKVTDDGQWQITVATFGYFAREGAPEPGAFELAHELTDIPGSAPQPGDEYLTGLGYAPAPSTLWMDTECASYRVVTPMIDSGAIPPR